MTSDNATGEIFMSDNREVFGRTWSVEEIRADRADRYPGEVSRLARSIGRSEEEFLRGLGFGLIRACPNESVNGCFLHENHSGDCEAREDPGRAERILFEDFSQPERCRYFRVPGNGQTQGLNVAFRDDGAVGLQPVDERITGFSLLPEAALTLRDLMVHVLGRPLYNVVAEDFTLAVPTEEQCQPR